MTLVRLWVDGQRELETVSAQNSQAARRLLQYGALCCDGSVVYKEDGTEQHIGDPTETSILVAAHKKRHGAGGAEPAVSPAGGAAL